LSVAISLRACIAPSLLSIMDSWLDQSQYEEQQLADEQDRRDRRDQQQLGNQQQLAVVAEQQLADEQDRRARQRMAHIGKDKGKNKDTRPKAKQKARPPAKALGKIAKGKLSARPSERSQRASSSSEEPEYALSIDETSYSNACDCDGCGARRRALAAEDSDEARSNLIEPSSGIGPSESRGERRAKAPEGQ
jgi:hypothetical protein